MTKTKECRFTVDISRVISGLCVKSTKVCTDPVDQATFVLAGSVFFLTAPR